MYTYIYFVKLYFWFYFLLLMLFFWQILLNGNFETMDSICGQLPLFICNEVED